MTSDDFDRVLSSEELLEPSSGFVSNVMDGVVWLRKNRLRWRSHGFDS